MQSAGEAVCGPTRQRMLRRMKVTKILEAARLSPSANNRQAWKFIVIKDKETKKRLARAALGQSFIETAPVVIVGCGTEAKSVMSCGQSNHTVDVSIAFALMIYTGLRIRSGNVLDWSLQRE